ncbi:hypothetical protein D3C74_471330 [compost metagenome]
MRESNIISANPISTWRRSWWAQTRVTSRLAMTAKRPEMEMARPARPSLAPRSRAIGVSRLTGINSAAISRATQRDMAPTAPQCSCTTGRGSTAA